MDNLALREALRRHGSFDVYFNKFGFLEGLSGETREICCGSLTCMAEYLLENDPPSQTEVGVNLRFMLFPIIRLVVAKTNKPLVDAGAFFNFCLEYINEHADHFIKTVEVSSHYIDMEAMISRRVAKAVIGIIKSDVEGV